jgi:phospholipid/cholesterol/gamma-HCH transport system permease protein
MMKLDNDTLFFDGDLNKETVPSLVKNFSDIVKKKVNFIDLNQVKTIDSSGVVFIDYVKSQATHAKIVNIPTEIENTIKTFQGDLNDVIIEPEMPGFFERTGDLIYNNIERAKDVAYLLSDILYWSAAGIFNHKGQRKYSVTQQILLIGMDAIPIIALLSFILGLILALQSAAQLKQFGADIYLADLISITMISEMGPILTAIMVSGRSGSAIASEIATMKVTEEIDALKMMALNPIRFVVVPKFHAMTVCMPLLVTLSMFVGILGGAIIGLTYLNITPGLFWSRVFDVVSLRDFSIAIGKSIVFSWVIVIIGVYYGLNVKGGAEGVGKVTTASVVASIFWIIVLDALNSLIFYY